MKIAYLINLYPKVSHSFVRREILALERLGHEVARFAVRHVDEKLADPSDVAEAEKTRTILDVGPAGLATALARQATTNPRRFAEAAQLAATIGQRSDRGITYHGAYLAEACVLLEWLREAGSEHLHAHFGTNSATVAMLTRVLGGPPYSVTVHGPEEFDKPEFISLGEKIKRSKFVCGVSSFGRSQLYRQVPFHEWKKIEVVRCGVDDVFLKEAPTPVPDVPRFVTVGRLCEQKGQLLLVEAAARLRDRGETFSLVLYVDGELRKPIEEMIASERLGDVVTITGWASAAEVKRHIVESRAMVLPSFAEGLPVVIMEALALGRPVLTTYIAGIPELVEPDRSGWLVPAGSVDHLVDAMQLALSTPAARLTEMGLTGRRAVEERHAIDVTAKQIAALFARP